MGAVGVPEASPFSDLLCLGCCTYDHVFMPIISVGAPLLGRLRLGSNLLWVGHPAESS
jgi:hypothetical protein